MATSSTPPNTDDSAQKFNGVKLMRLIVDGGTRSIEERV